MALKTYLLAPNFTFEPDGPIRIGRIIANPFHPTKPIHIPSEKPLTATHTDFDNSFSREKNSSTHASIWAQFLQTTSLNVGAGVSADALTQYTMDSMETIRLKEDPTDKEASELVKDPAIQAAINAGITGTAPVFMITGIKVAKGFRLHAQIAKTRNANVDVSTVITEEIGVGTRLGTSRVTSTEESSRSGSDIIFAYQLHIITRKGWWSRKKVSADIYAPSAAFLNKDSDGVKEEEVEVGGVTQEELAAVAEENEDDSLKVLNARDGEEDCVCIAFREF